MAFVCTGTLVLELRHQGSTASISSMHTHKTDAHTHQHGDMCRVQDLKSPAGPLRSSSSTELGQGGSGTGAEGRGRGSEGQACLERLSRGRQRSSAALCGDSLVQMAAVWFSRNGKQLWPAPSPPTLDWDPTGEGGHLHEKDNLANQRWPCQNPKSHFPFQPADWKTPLRIRLNHFQLCCWLDPTRCWWFSTLYMTLSH